MNLAHHFEATDLQDILAFNTAERRQAFVKDLEETALMQSGDLPPPTDSRKVAIRREDLNDRLMAPFQDLVHLDDLLADVIDIQRTSFGSKDLPKACPADQVDARMLAPLGFPSI